MGTHIIIKEARCSFPQLYSTEVKEDESFGPGIALVLEKEAHAKIIAEVTRHMIEAIANNPKLKKSRPPSDKLCLRKPDPEREELMYKPGNLILKANSGQRLPVVLEPDGRTLMTKETDKIYSGCYVNAKVEIWGQANKWGKRVNAKLIAVQFNPKPADSFDGSYVSPEEAVKGFDSLDDNMGDLGADLLGGEDIDEDNLLGD